MADWAVGQKMACLGTINAPALIHPMLTFGPTAWALWSNDGMAGDAQQGTSVGVSRYWTEERAWLKKGDSMRRWMGVHPIPQSFINLGRESNESFQLGGYIQRSKVVFKSLRQAVKEGVRKGSLILPTVSCYGEELDGVIHHLLNVDSTLLWPISQLG